MTPQSDRTAETAGAVPLAPTHALGFTDNFGSGTHGPELDHRPKSVQIMAAESCFMGTTDGQVINVL